MQKVKRLTASLISTAIIGTSLLTLPVSAESPNYDSWLEFDKNSCIAMGLPLGVTAGDLISTVKDADGIEISGDKTVSTGCTILKDGLDYILAVKGDVSGDGQINSTDFTQVRRAYLELFEIDAAQQAAADVDCDGKVNSTDFMQIRKHFLGLYSITYDTIGKLLDQSVYASTAEELMLTVCEDFYSLDTHILITDIDKDYCTTLWPFGSFIEALADTYVLYPENETIKTYYLDALDHGLENFKVKEDLTTPAGEFKDVIYYNASAWNHGDYYYDDNAWIAIQFLNAYEILGDEKYLTKAEEILAFFETGIDDAFGGGLYWDKRFNCKNTCADGPAAIAYLWAYKYTGNEHYLDRGKELMDWLNSTLRDEDGLYWDNIDSNGNINKWKGFYNQGTPIYALCLLYEITGDEEYKTLVDKTVDTSLNEHTFGARWDNGIVFAIKGDPIFKSWCIGWLIRGYEQYVTMTGEATEFYTKMDIVLDDNLETKDENGYYDPYFLTGAWGGESTTEPLQQCGIVSIYALCAYYDIYIAPTM